MKNKITSIILLFAVASAAAGMGVLRSDRTEYPTTATSEVTDYRTQLLEARQEIAYLRAEIQQLQQMPTGAVAEPVTGDPNLDHVIQTGGTFVSTAYPPAAPWVASALGILAFGVQTIRQLRTATDRDRKVEAGKGLGRIYDGAYSQAQALPAGEARDKIINSFERGRELIVRVNSTVGKDVDDFIRETETIDLQ